MAPKPSQGGSQGINLFFPIVSGFQNPKREFFLNDPQELAKARYKIGDQLWVRETLYRDKDEPSWWRYKADDALVLVDDEQP